MTSADLSFYLIEIGKQTNDLLAWKYPKIFCVFSKYFLPGLILGNEDEYCLTNENIRMTIMRRKIGIVTITGSFIAWKSSLRRLLPCNKEEEISFTSGKVTERLEKGRFVYSWAPHEDFLIVCTTESHCQKEGDLGHPLKRRRDQPYLPPIGRTKQNL